MSHPFAVEVTIRREDPRALESRILIDELAATLALCYGDSAQSRFHVEDVCAIRSAFVVARTCDGGAVGCGGFRRVSFEVAELKRVYRRPEFPGVGVAIIRYLEDLAVDMGYRRIIAQTREANRRATAFYRRHGYQPADAPDDKPDVPAARFFAKHLPLR